MRCAVEPCLKHKRQSPGRDPKQLQAGLFKYGESGITLLAPPHPYTNADITRASMQGILLLSAWPSSTAQVQKLSFQPSGTVGEGGRGKEDPVVQGFPTFWTLPLF